MSAAGRQMIPMLNPDTWEPPVSDVSCGNREDLFRKQRRHIPVSMGTDLAYFGDTGEKRLSLITSCARCGRQEAHPL